MDNFNVLQSRVLFTIQKACFTLRLRHSGCFLSPIWVPTEHSLHFPNGDSSSAIGWLHSQPGSSEETMGHYISCSSSGEDCVGICSGLNNLGSPSSNAEILAIPKVTCQEMRSLGVGQNKIRRAELSQWISSLTKGPILHNLNCESCKLTLSVLNSKRQLHFVTDIKKKTIGKPETFIFFI